MLCQNLVQGCVKTWSKYVAQQNWTKFWRKTTFFFPLFVWLVFLKNLILPAERRGFLKKTKKGKTEKTWTKFWLKKRLFLDQVLTLQHICWYIYIYMDGEGLTMDLPFMCFCIETLLSDIWADKVPVFNHSLLLKTWLNNFWIEPQAVLHEFSNDVSQEKPASLEGHTQDPNCAVFVCRVGVENRVEDWGLGFWPKFKLREGYPLGLEFN